MVFNAFVFWSRVLNFATVLIFDPWRRYKLFYRFAHWHQVNFVDSRLETYFHFIIMMIFSDYIQKRIDYCLDICYIHFFGWLLCYLSYNIYHWRYQVRIWILWIYLWAGMAKYFINRRKTPHVSVMIKPFPWSLLLMLSDNHMALFLFQLKRCTGVLLSYLLGEWICIYAKL